MNAHAAHALRAACLCVLGLLAVAARPTRAQTATTPEVYEDRLISGGTLKPDISAGDYLSTSDPTGLARSVRIDAVTSVLSQTGPNAAPTAHENGFVGDVQWETSVYGAFSADAALRIGAGAERFVVSGNDATSFSLHQRGMPFDGGWQADNALGDLNAPLINLARQQPRFMLSSGTMLGAATEWRGPANVQIVAGGGEPGVFEGIRIPTFQTLGGSTATLGAEWSPAPQWTVGGEYAGARAANIYYQPAITSPLLPAEVSNQRISSNTTLLSGAWQDGSTRGQLNFIDGTLDGRSNAFGMWADGAYTSGHYTQTFGVFHIDPNLAWGNQLIASDMQGGYYRLGYQSRRWTADFGVDEVLSVSGHGVNSTFLNGNARYQLWRDTGIGGVANVLLSSDDGRRTAWSIEGYLDNANSWGTGRFQLDYADDSQTQDATATLQQSWTLHPGTRLATSAGIEHIHSAALPGLPQADSTIVRLAAYGGGDLTARLSLDGSVQWAEAVQGRAAPSTSADINLTYQMTRSWEFILSFYENRIGSWTPLVVTSPLTPPVPVPLPSQGQTGVFLTLRYQDARGGHFVPLGGAPGAGSGRLTGVVYLDANENGHYDAGEAGAANVTVILDGRFSRRTDANGRFDFAAVAAGHHVLKVQQDNLPLPWTVVNEGRTEVNVATRDRVDVNIGAVRLK